MHSTKSCHYTCNYTFNYFTLPLSTSFIFLFFFFFFFNDTATTEIYTLSLHDALPISMATPRARLATANTLCSLLPPATRSEEHTSELQSRLHLVCRLLLEKKKKKIHTHHINVENKNKNCYRKNISNSFKIDALSL